MKRSLGEQIRYYRKDVLKITQAELAKRADIPFISLSMAERGKIKQPWFQTVVKIIKWLEVDFNTFIEGIEIDK